MSRIGVADRGRERGEAENGRRRYQVKSIGARCAQ